MPSQPPGKYARQLADERRLIRRKLGLLALLELACIPLFLVSLPLALALPVVFAVLWIVDHFFIGWMDLALRRERDALRGARSEVSVAAILDALPDSVVLHGVRAQYGDIDHLVFRKNGTILLIETKARSGIITKKNVPEFLPQAQRNLYWLRDLLKAHFRFQPYIHVAVVFPNAEVQVRNVVGGVNFLTLDYLPRWIAKKPGNQQVTQRLWPKIEEVRARLKTEG